MAEDGSDEFIEAESIASNHFSDSSNDSDDGQDEDEASKNTNNDIQAKCLVMRRDDGELKYILNNLSCCNRFNHFVI